MLMSKLSKDKRCAAASAALRGPPPIADSELGSSISDLGDGSMKNVGVSRSTNKQREIHSGSEVQGILKVRLVENEGAGAAS